MENSNRSQSAADDAEPSQFSQGDELDHGQEIAEQSSPRLENHKSDDSDVPLTGETNMQHNRQQVLATDELATQVSAQHQLKSLPSARDFPQQVVNQQASYLMSGAPPALGQSQANMDIHQQHQMAMSQAKFDTQTFEQQVMAARKANEDGSADKMSNPGSSLFGAPSAAAPISFPGTDADMVHNHRMLSDVQMQKMKQSMSMPPQGFVDPVQLSQMEQAQNAQRLQVFQAQILQQQKMVNQRTGLGQPMPMAVFPGGDAAVAASQDGRLNDADQNFIQAALEQRALAAATGQNEIAVQRQSIAPGFAMSDSQNFSQSSLMQSIQSMPDQAMVQQQQQQIAMSAQKLPPSARLQEQENALDIGDIELQLSQTHIANEPSSLLMQQQRGPMSPGPQPQSALIDSSYQIDTDSQVESEACQQHQQEHILFCLKCQEKICTKCLDTNHLLHPVVPLNSINKLDFKTSLQKEIEKSLEEIRVSESLVQRKIGSDLKEHKIALRNHIIQIRDTLRQDFDDFFNQMLSCIRADWNLFEMQEQLSKETRKFAKEIVGQLQRITTEDEFEQIYYHNDLKKFYENLSVAQAKVQAFKQDWGEFEKGVDTMVDGLKGYSEFDIIDGATLKNFLAENLVMNYSNIEIHKLLFQQIISGKQSGAGGSGALGLGAGSSEANAGAGGGFARNAQNNVGRLESGEAGGANGASGSVDRGNEGRWRGLSGNRVEDKNAAQNISFNRNSQLAMANNFASTGIKMMNKQQKREEEDVARTNKIHFFKFDQRIVTFYNVDQERKQREVLNIDFNIPIRFCSIQTNDGRIFITGGAKNTSQSSNHAYEFRNGTLIQLPNMINPREGHCLAAVGNELIYAIGSRLYNTSKTCEVYSIENNCWREKPELNRNRYLSTAVTIQQRYIYVFGGYEPSVTDIERLDTSAAEQPTYWELIKVWSSSLEADIKYWFGACAISQHEILIFGGKKDGNSSSSSYVFDTQQNHIQKTGSLPNKDTFYQRTFLCKNNQVYAYGYENDTAYIYNITGRTWQKK